MNRHEWKLAILASLEPSGRLASQSGKSEYDNLVARAKAQTDLGNTTELLEGVLLAAKDGVAQTAEWWLALLQFINGYNFQVSSALRTRVIDFVEGDPCSDPIARGYILRSFADLGLPMDWHRLGNQVFYQRLLNIQPLLLADALVRSKENELAKAAVAKAKSTQGVQAYHIQQMLDRWRDAGFTLNLQVVNTAQLLEGFAPVSYEPFIPLALAA